MPTRADVLVIGGGIIGVSSAYYLARAGLDVHLVEQGEIAAGSSYGNAGLVTPSDSAPLPSPSALSKGLQWMLDARSPLYIKPRPDPELLSWLWRFRGACNRSAFRRAASLLTTLSRLSLELYEQLRKEEEIPALFQRRGLLLLYRTEVGFEEGQHYAEMMKAFGLDSDTLNREDVRARVSLVRPDVVGGIYFRTDAHVDPASFVRSLAERASVRGVTIHTRTEALRLQVKQGRVQAVFTTRGDFVARHVIVASGAWSPLLVRDLGVRLPVQAAKGYSITVGRPPQFPELPLILDEAKVAVTPLGERLRFAGTLELGGLDMSVNLTRVRAIEEGVRRYLNLDPQGQPLVELWRGWRPCTPDGYPVIGRLSTVENLWVATGHCMLGITQGPGTGKLVADMVTGREPMLDATPFHPARFGL